MVILEWIRNQIKKIQTSNDSTFIEDIKTLESEIDMLNIDIRDLTDYIDSMNNLVVKAGRYDSLENYEMWLEENIVPKATYYNFGSGRKQVHTIFADSIKDEEIIREFIIDDLGFLVNVDWTADQIVYEFNRALSRKYPTIKYYAYDQTLYGQIEYWAIAKETIEKLREGGKSFDCDDSMILRYSCLYYLLKDYFPEEQWRLRGFIVDIWTGGGHALLAWVKEGPNDWIPIETTFYDTKQAFIWNNNYRIRDQMLYQIRYSFDHEHEYTRI